MGKRKWKRVRMADLASTAEQERVLGIIDQEKGQPGTDSLEKRGHETATTGR